jgi:hypothetical protein
VEEAKAHWLQIHQHLQQQQIQEQQQHQDEQEQEQKASTSPLFDPLLENKDASAASAHAPELECAKLVEADDSGRPLIVRRTHPETCAASTMVMDEHGSTRSFGSETVKSMMATDESEIASWIQAMKDHHVRGLVHEIRERLYESSGKLQARREELEQFSKRLTFEYFGLSEASREKELDNAYRRLARSMHPDKNGGTTEAKQRFQAMKERYEDLKTQIAEQSQAPHPPQSEQESAQDASVPGEERGEESGNRQAGETGPEMEEAESSSEGQHGCQSGDANPKMAEANAGSTKASRPSREEAEASAWKMLRQLKMIDQNMKIVESDFRRVQADVELLCNAP